MSVIRPFVIWLLVIGTVAGVGAPLALAKSEPVPQPQRPLPPAVERLLAWLPGDTETVMAAQGPFPIPAPRGLETSFVLEESLRLLPLSLLLVVDDGVLERKLRGSRILVAVEGSRQFRSPKRLGLMLYDGCQIVQFARGTEKRLEECFVVLVKNAKRRERILGQDAADFQERREEDTCTLLIA